MWDGVVATSYGPDRGDWKFLLSYNVRRLDYTKHHFRQRARKCQTQKVKNISKCLFKGNTQFIFLCNPQKSCLSD